MSRSRKGKSNSSSSTRTSVITKIKLRPQDLEEKSEEEERELIDAKELFSAGQRNGSCRRCEHHKSTISKLEAQISQYQTRERSGGAGLHRNNVSMICAQTGKKIRMRKTDILCWWDCHPFDGYPVALPHTIQDGKYHVTGCFCSFNCMLAYNLYYLADNSVHLRRSLALNMFREMYDIPITEAVDISEAPPRELLASFGGTLEIEDYRHTFNLARKYWKSETPIRYMDINVVEGEDKNPIEGGGYAMSRAPVSQKKGLYKFVAD